MPKVNRMMDGGLLRYAALAVALAFVLGLVAGCPTVTPTPNDNTGGDQNMNGGGSSGGDATAGATLFTDNGCSACHCDDGAGACDGAIGPDITGKSTDDLTFELQDANSGHVGGQFPDLTAQDLADLAAFLAG